MATGLHTNTYHISSSILLTLTFVQHRAREPAQPTCFYYPFTTQLAHPKGIEEIVSLCHAAFRFLSRWASLPRSHLAKGSCGSAVNELRTTYLSCMQTSYLHERNYFSHHAPMKKGQKYNVFAGIMSSVMTKAISSLRANVV